MSGGDITVSFDSDEQLAAIENDIEDSSGTVLVTLTETDFSETDNGDGTFTYSATHTVQEDGEYTSTLIRAEDSDGYDGATGQSDTVTIQQSTLVDDFEDGDITEYSGDTSSFTVDSQSPVFSGTYSLKTDDSSNGDFIYATDNDLNSGKAPQPGDTFSVQVSCGSGWQDNASIAQVAFFVYDSSNFYLTGIQASPEQNSKNQIYLGKFSGGNFTNLGSEEGLGLQEDTEYTLKVTPDSNGVITARVADPTDGSVIGSVTHDEGSYDQTPATIGFRSNGEPMTWDDIKST